MVYRWPMQYADKILQLNKERLMHMVTTAEMQQWLAITTHSNSDVLLVYLH